MREEVFTLFCVCLASAIGEILLPENPKSGTKKAFRFLTCLVVLLLVLSPFMRLLGKSHAFFGGEFEWEEASPDAFDGALQDAVIAQSEKELREGLYNILRQTYDISEDTCRIVIAFDEDGALLHVSLFLSGSALTKNPSVIERDLAQRLSCSVEVR